MSKFWVSLLLGSSLLAFCFWFQPIFQVSASQDCEQISCNKDSQSDDEYLSCNKQKQTCWEEKIRETQGAAITLNNTIAILNGQIKVQELQINQTLTEINKLEKEIDELSLRISGLNLSLDRLSDILIKRVQEQYKRSYLSPVFLILNSRSFSNQVKEYKYLSFAKNQTARAMKQAEEQKQTFDEQKILKEAKQKQVEAKKRQLEAERAKIAKQRSEQQYLLQETKNNEAKYQQELAATMAELGAIQNIMAGYGDETKVGEVKEGDTIASIIAGASPCSTGTHLHFEVVKDGSNRDPAGFLRPVDTIWDNAPDGSFGWGGGWNWPVENPARITQGYGMTYYARVRRAYGGNPHTGIDMVSKDKANYKIKAVKNGSLFRGSIKCGSSLLRYVKVEQDDNTSTYYLHVNY